jgi:two-component system chemotaxis response regulator CheY
MSGKKKKVLIVDDSNVVRNVLKAILENSGFEVVGFAKDGLEAISKYKELKPDIIALDLTMPKMDGIQTLRILKSMDKKLKIVMVTSINAMDKIVECKNAGACQYIVKPFEEEKVVSVFSKLL